MSGDGAEAGRKHPAPVAGPSMPAHLLARSSATAPSIGPSIPPHLMQRSDDDAAEAPVYRRVLGPTMPPRGDEEEEIKLSNGAQVFLDREKRMKEAAEREATGLPSKSHENSTSRPDWMMAPPTAQSFSESLQKDQSAALKNRGFSQAQNARVQRGKGGGGLGGIDDDNSSLWTETPQEREQRLREEELGIRARVVHGKQVETDEERERKEIDREREEKLQQAIREHEAQRGPSLLEQHQSKRREELKGKKASDRDKERGRSNEEYRRKKRRSESDSEGSKVEDRKHRRRDREMNRDRPRNNRHRRDNEGESDSNSSFDDRRRRERRKSSSRHSEKGTSERDRHHLDSHRSHRDTDRDGDERRKEKERERNRKQKRRDREREEKEEKKGGAPTMIWDREAALSVGGKLLDNQKRMETIRSAAGLGSRFGSGTARYL